MRKHYPLNSNGAEDAGQLPWKDGVPSTGVEGSYPGSALFVDTEAEILAAIDAAGLVRSGSNLSQLIQAIARGIWLGQFGGTASAITATVPNGAVIPALLSGMRVRGIAASNFTGTGGTLAITGIGSAGNTVSCPLVASDGVTPLAAGAWTAGQFLTFDVDASGNARFGAGGGSVSTTQFATYITGNRMPTNFKRLSSNIRTTVSGTGSGMVTGLTMSGYTKIGAANATNLLIFAEVGAYGGNTAGQAGPVVQSMNDGNGHADSKGYSSDIYLSGVGAVSIKNMAVFLLQGVAPGPVILSSQFGGQAPGVSWSTNINPDSLDYGQGGSHTGTGGNSYYTIMEIPV
ncbi:hypothetical protein ACLBX9_27845 [Methylobacterium sp. A49B]